MMRFRRQHSLISVVVVAVVLVLACGWSCLPVAALDTEAWKNRTIYQIITDRFAVTPGTTPDSCSNPHRYCGGTWQGIRSQLDYISGMGFDAIWITPIPLQVDNVEGMDGFHGYWMKDLTQLNPHFGTEQDLQQMIEECHNRDIAVMLDVVANHVGPVDMDFRQIVPFNDASHYHPVCQITDWTNQHQVEVCRLANLPDLDQDNSFVRSTLLQWIAETVKKYAFDGVRIDTVPEIRIDFWPDYVNSAGVFSMGEVFNGNMGYVAGYAKVLDSVLSYPLYFTLKSVFQQQQSMYNLQNTLQQYQNTFADMNALGTFIDNHDNARFLNGQRDYTLYENAIAYVLTGSGIPIIYYGTEQGYSGGGDPYNREPLWPNYNSKAPLYQFIALVNTIKQKVPSYRYTAQVQRYADDQFYAYTRGNVFVALTNVGSNGSDVTRTITYHQYADGTTLCNLLDVKDCITVQNKQFQVTLRNGMCKIYYVV